MSASDSSGPTAPGPGWASSLRVRLLAATLVAVAVALLLAGVFLDRLFREHVMRQLEGALTAQLDQVTARLEFDATGAPRIDPQALSDPRWTRPFSGLYWQLDERRDGVPRAGVLRSRSLWDHVLALDGDVLADGEVHLHRARGPQGAPLVVVERTVRGEARAPGERADPVPSVRWRLLVAADSRAASEAVSRFTGALVAALAVLLLLLGAAALAQVAVGLSPLRALQRALGDVREGRAARLQGRFPVEVQPLIDDFNRVLDLNAEGVARARTHAGNLAHAIRTPLTVLAQAAASAQGRPDARAGDLARLVDEQVALARRQVDRHLARSRAAAASRLPGARAPVLPSLRGLVRVLERVHADRGIALRLEPSGFAVSATFAGEEQDLQEMLGNVLDNAFKWARTELRVEVRPVDDRAGAWLRVVVDDDGPGVAPAERDAVMQRGVRADESVPGSGLGLAIVDDLAALYGGEVTLSDGPLGGLRVELVLPATG